MSPSSGPPRQLDNWLQFLFAQCVMFFYSLSVIFFIVLYATCFVPVCSGWSNPLYRRCVQEDSDKFKQVRCVRTDTRNIMKMSHTKRYRFGSGSADSLVHYDYHFDWPLLRRHRREPLRGFHRKRRARDGALGGRSKGLQRRRTRQTKMNCATTSAVRDFQGPCLFCN